MSDGVQIADAKAPWVMFERRAEEDRAATIEAGVYRAKDVDFVLVTPHGSKDQHEAIASEWFQAKEQDVREGRFDETWLRTYRAAYENWKAGKEIPVEGTPILNWPLLSPSQVKLLQGLRVLTVEVLAGANEELISRLGMGGRNLVQKAKDFLAQAQNGGKVVEEMSALRIRMEAIDQRNKDLEAQNQTLRAAVPQGLSAPAPEQPQGSSISATDLIDDNKPTTRKL